MAAALNPCNYIAEKIFNEITETPPVAVNKGGAIKKGVDKELDELRNIASGGKEYLVNIQQREAEQTGIATLKIGFNNVFGYYLGSNQFAQKQSAGCMDAQANACQCRTIHYARIKRI